VEEEDHKNAEVDQLLDALVDVEETLESGQDVVAVESIQEVGKSEVADGLQKTGKVVRGNGGQSEVKRPKRGQTEEVRDEKGPEIPAGNLGRVVDQSDFAHECPEESQANADDGQDVETDVHPNVPLVTQVGHFEGEVDEGIGGENQVEGGEEAVGDGVWVNYEPPSWTRRLLRILVLSRYFLANLFEFADGEVVLGKLFDVGGKSQEPLPADGGPHDRQETDGPSQLQPLGRVAAFFEYFPNGGLGIFTELVFRFEEVVSLH
jgi:hypothetical protein